MDFVDRLANTSFLGREFLTWLWFKSDTQEGLMTLEDGGPAAEVWFTDNITLSGAGDGAERVTVRAEDPSLSPEARMALKQGKKVEKAYVRIVRGQREWATNVAAESLALSSIKIPALLTREEDDKLRERLALLDELDAMVTSLFKGFLAVRGDRPTWEPELDALRAWVMGGEEKSRGRALANAFPSEAGEAVSDDDGVVSDDDGVVTDGDGVVEEAPAEGEPAE